MATSLADIRRWFDDGIEQKAKWMIVVCDTFDYGDYPVYADTPGEFWQKYDECTPKTMRNVMETYDLGKSKDAQIAT